MRYQTDREVHPFLSNQQKVRTVNKIVVEVCRKTSETHVYPKVQSTDLRFLTSTTQCPILTQTETFFSGSTGGFTGTVERKGGYTQWSQGIRTVKKVKICKIIRTSLQRTKLRVFTFYYNSQKSIDERKTHKRNHFIDRPRKQPKI